MSVPHCSRSACPLHHHCPCTSYGITSLPTSICLHQMYSDHLVVMKGAREQSRHLMNRAHGRALAAGCSLCQVAPSSAVKVLTTSQLDYSTAYLCQLVLIAGQGIVQMARSRINLREEYALKFFVSKQAFKSEASLYTDRSNPLVQFLPQVCCTGSNGISCVHCKTRMPNQPCCSACFTSVLFQLLTRVWSWQSHVPSDRSLNVLWIWS